MAWWTDLAAKLKALFKDVPGGFDWDTAGPTEDEHPIVGFYDQAWANHGPAFEGGWWSRYAQYRPANPGRIGPTIIPSFVVVHTTDTLDGFAAIVKSWTETVGARNAAHFIIGRGPSDGVVQFAPITKNANHAGGTPHGNFRGYLTNPMHPNTCSVGIELVAGGRLVKTAGGWLHKDSGKYVPASEVFVDSTGHGWHKVTDYQLAMLDLLLADLGDQLRPLEQPDVIPDGDYAKNGVAYYAPFPSSRIVGHVTLDPINKLDPGPQVMEHLRARSLRAPVQASGLT